MDSTMKTSASTDQQEPPDFFTGEVLESPISRDSPSNPLKSHHVLPVRTWGRASNFTIHQAGTPVVGVHIQREAFGLGDAQVSVRTLDKTILATCRLRGLRDKYLLLGNPDCTDVAEWTPLEPSGKWDPSRYHFQYGGQRYSWTRTRRREYGASKWDGRSFKLVRVVESGEGVLLAVYVHQALWTKKDEARIDYFCELGWELEMLSLAAAMGIAEEMRRRQ